MINNLGDTHNFGKQVKRISTEDGIFFQKPRSTFWESLFFGKNSDIGKILSSKDFSFHTFFQLESSKESLENSLQKEIKRFIPVIGKDITLLNLYYSIMDLCSYSLAMGIMDLNHENVLISNQGLTIVDVECCFGKFNNVVATGLIPGRNNLLRMSALANFISENFEIYPDIIEKLLSRFFLSFEHVISKKNELIDVFDSKKKAFNDIPIRLVIRDTYIYKMYFDKKLDSSFFFEEEVIQLKRGDYPYFFTYLEDKDIYFLKENTDDIVPISKKFRVHTNEIGLLELPNLKTFYSHNLVAKDSIPLSLLELADVFFLFCKDDEVNIQNKLFKIEINKNLVKVYTKYGNWLMAREYTDENGNIIEDHRIKEKNLPLTFIPKKINPLIMPIKE